MKDPLEIHFGISVAQVIKADRQLWVRLIELTREGILPDSAGKRPLETLLPLARLDPLFNALLQPLPKPYSSYEKQMNLRAFVDGAQPYPTKGAKGGSKGKGGKAMSKGKGSKSGKSSSSIPEELKGIRTQTNKGYSYCWGFNLAAGCTSAKPGGYCTKGFHGCMKCGGPSHGASSCDRK